MLSVSEKEFQNIVGLLNKLGASFQVIEHEPVRTSSEAALVRGASLSQGVKALVIKFSRSKQSFFAVIDLPASLKLDWRKAKQVLKADEIRFATEKEVLEKTGCEPGGVPPLGHSTNLPILVDSRVFEQDFVEFNAGLRTKSIKLKSIDLRKAFEAIGAAFFELGS